MEALLDRAAVPLAVVQVGGHPYHPLTELIDFAPAHGLRVIAHSPLPAPGLLDDALRAIAAAHNVSTAQVVLRWALQHGGFPIPSSTSPDYVHANAFGVALSEDEVAAIDALHRPDFGRP
jgi:alcohol dehydrogenase (NADP+)